MWIFNLISSLGKVAFKKDIMWIFRTNKCFVAHCGLRWNAGLLSFAYAIAIIEVLEGDNKKSSLAQNLAISKKSTISHQSMWNLAKITISWVGFVARISAWSD